MSCGRRLARASRERRSSCSGASPRRQRLAADEAGEAYLVECPATSPDGFRCPRRGHANAWSLSAARTARVRLVREPGLDGGADRAPSDQDRHGASLAGEPDRRPSRPVRRPSRPVVSPTYAQGSWYGTNRVMASAPGHLTSPAAPLLSTERAAQPSGRSPSRSRSHVVRTGRVFRKNRTRGRGGGDAGAGAGAGQRQRVTRRHLDAYLDEFVFRSNRRHNLAVAFGTLLDQAHHVRAHRDTGPG
jgi:hypothetical protein